MRKTWLLPVLVILVAAPIVSCNDEDPVAPKSQYKSLSGPRDNVLYNLQKACVARNIDRYSELLDENFVFHFSEMDIEEGYIDHSPWSRVEDVGATTNMFDPNFTKYHIGPVIGIDLVLTYLLGDSTWTPVPPEDHPDYPGETWYEKTVDYRLTIQMKDLQFISPNLQASFFVRKATVEGYKNPIWRVVVWGDDPRPGFALPLVDAVSSRLATDQTWGQMKEFFKIEI